MSQVHYVVRRSRSGRFNFTLMSEGGRLTGSVIVVTTGKTGSEIEGDAHDQILHLAKMFAEAAASNKLDGIDSLSKNSGQATSRPVSAIALDDCSIAHSDKC